MVENNNNNAANNNNSNIQNANTNSSGGSAPADSGIDNSASPSGLDSGAPAGQVDNPNASANQDDQQGQADKKSPEIDPELSNYIEAKNLNFVKEHLNNEPVKKLLNMFKETDNYALKTRSEYDKYKSETQQKFNEYEASLMALEQDKTTGEELSPAENLQKNYEETLSSLMALHGCQDLNELMQNYPKLFNSIKNTYDAEYRSALLKEVDWKLNTDKRQKEKAERENRFKDEYNKIKTQAVSNVQDLRSQDPQVVENFSKSGIENFLQSVCKSVNLPYEYLAADKNIMAFAAKAAKAMITVDSLPDRDVKMKQQWEQELIKTKQAELPSASTPMTFDIPEEVLKFKQSLGRSGVSLAD